MTPSRAALCACTLACLAPPAPALRAQPAQRVHGSKGAVPADCRPLAEYVQDMKAQIKDPNAQALGCRRLTSCVDSSRKEQQDQAAAAGVLEAAIGAQKLFPSDKQVQINCTHAVSKTILLNRENGLRAGQLGGLNMSFTAYQQWMNDPEASLIGGPIGAYFDYVDENRHIARQLGGLQLFVQTIKNNYDLNTKKLNPEPVKHAMHGLASGCWKNQDICHFPEIYDLERYLMELTFFAPSEAEIAEDVMRVLRSLFWYADVYRHSYGDKGGPNGISQVLKANRYNSRVVSQVCETITYMVGSFNATSPTGQVHLKGQDYAIQEQLSRSDVTKPLLQAILAHEQLSAEHQGADARADDADNMDLHCMRALWMLAQDVGLGYSKYPFVKENREMIETCGLLQRLQTKLGQEGTLTPEQRQETCRLMSIMSASAAGC